MSTQKLSVRICRKCGTVCSVAKERCENCRNPLSEPMSSELAKLESEIIRVEKYIAEKSASMFYCSKKDSEELFVSTAIHRKFIPTLPSERKRQDQRYLKRLKKRLEHIKAEEEKAAAHNN